MKTIIDKDHEVERDINIERKGSKVLIEDSFKNIETKNDLDYMK